MGRANWNPNTADSLARLATLRPHLGELALGDTAVGTGLNTHPEFAKRTIASIAEETGLTLREATNHFEAQAARDAADQVVFMNRGRIEVQGTPEYVFDERPAQALREFLKPGSES